ncbi:MAG: hypothetical protein QM760_22770 [Nibricoccus sp.]
MDDTNPGKEDVEYVDSITPTRRWLIAGWADHCLVSNPRAPRPRRGRQRKVRLLPRRVTP